MSNHTGNISQPVRLEHFLAQLSSAELARALRYVGRDHHLSLLYLEDGYFTLRAHDEIISGGYKLVGESFPYVPSVAGDPIVYTSLSQVPTLFPIGTGTAIIDMDLSGSGVDLTGWALDAEQGAVSIRFRKVDVTPNRITWTDHLGINYAFVEKQGEFITLVYDDTSGLFHII